MFYKVKFINKKDVYKTLIFADKSIQTKLEESKQIEDINYEFTNNMIYLDDTIENIKFKIIKNLDTDISIDEIFLFSKEILNIVQKNYTIF